MAKINYSDYTSRQASSTAFKKELKVGYFNSLKDDGDEAIVRFNYNTPADFDMATVHKVKVGEYYKYISCLRTDRNSPVDTCPLCNSSTEEVAKVQFRMFAKLITYSKDESGNLVASAHVWNRPALFSKDIVSAYNEGIDNGFYSAGTPIKEVVFKIKRDGVKGSRDTKYRLIATNPAVYKRELYTADFSAFENLDLAHHSYMCRTEDEIKTYLTTGEFPSRVNTSTEESKVTTDPSSTGLVMGEQSDRVSTTVVSNSPTAAETATVPPTTAGPRRYTF